MRKTTLSENKETSKTSILFVKLENDDVKAYTCEDAKEINQLLTDLESGDLGTEDFIKFLVKYKIIQSFNKRTPAIELFISDDY